MLLLNVKMFECSCADGFTGDFCEFKTEQNQLLFLRDYDLIFNVDGQRIEKSFTFDDNAYASISCTTMLNGEALIFGGWDGNLDNFSDGNGEFWRNIRRQVTHSSWYC